MTITLTKVWTRSLAVFAVGAASIALAGCSLLGNVTNGGGTTETGDGENADVFTIKVGDCLLDAALSGEISEVPTIDCTEPHDSEAYASVQIPDGDFPGDDAIYAQADADCVAAFPDYVGIAYDASTLEYSYFYPTEQSWSNGDREILCLLYDPAGQTTGSLAGSAK